LTIVAYPVYRVSAPNVYRKNQVCEQYISMIAEIRIDSLEALTPKVAIPQKFAIGSPNESRPCYSILQMSRFQGFMKLPENSEKRRRRKKKNKNKNKRCGMRNAMLVVNLIYVTKNPLHSRALQLLQAVHIHIFLEQGNHVRIEGLPVWVVEVVLLR
jgi:hypothetical protein